MLEKEEDVDFRKEEKKEEESVADAAEQEDFVRDADDEEAQNMATSSAHHFIPAEKSRESLQLLICMPTDLPRQNLTFSTKRNKQWPPTHLGSGRHWTEQSSLPR
jgi:hypothetical protein